MYAKNLASRTISGICVVALALLLASCKTPLKQKYTVGGMVSGLAGSGLMLQNNGSGNLAIPADGGFTFPGPLEKGETYRVTVRTQPPGQSCAVANGAGTVSGNVTNVAVNCGGNAVTVGGTVSGLTGAGLVLQNNGTDNLSVATDGVFTFITPVASGSPYSVAVLTQPGSPAQTCTVTSGNGTATTSVTNVAVDCVTNIYSIGGTVSGLAGTGFVLQNNGGDNLSLNANGAFTFATSVASGAPYSVTVLAQPSGQVCGVGNGSGTVTSTNVSEITVTCTVVVVPGAGPTVSLAFGVKELQFSWTAVGGASFYRLLEDPDGVSGYTQVGADITALSVNHTVPVHLRLNAKYIVQACSVAGCTDSSAQILGTNLTQAIGYFKASNTGAGDQFGFAVALSGDGNTLAVGARTEDSGSTGIDSVPDESALDAGAVYVFARSGGAWSQQAYVKASNTGAGDQFGTSVALSTDGSTLAVGAPNEGSASVGINSTPDESAPAAGAAYVFARSAGAWSQQAYVKASNAGASDAFGIAVAVSADGNTLAVGASGEDSSTAGIDSTPNESASSAGAVYVYARSAGAWSQQAYVKASNPGVGDQFGNSVALSGDGDTLAVGALSEDSSTTGIDSTPNEAAPNAGAAYVFTRSVGAWSQQAYVKPSRTGSNDQFGASVALSADGNALAVGVQLEDLDGTGIGSTPTALLLDSGAVYFYTRSAGSWSQRAYVKASNTGAGDRFGMSVALSGDGSTLAAGAQLEDGSGTGIDGASNESAASAGAVYLY